MLPKTAFAQDQWDGFFLGFHAGAVDSFSTIRKVWDNVSLRAEYLYYGFNEDVQTCNVCTGGPAYADGEIHTFRSGITFLFN